jgi:kynureninase
MRTKCSIIWTWLPSTECAAAKTKSIEPVRRTEFGDTCTLVTREIHKREGRVFSLLRHPSTCNSFTRTSARERVHSPFILRLSPLPYYNYTSRVWVGV